MSRDTTVIPFRQPEVIDDPLSELAREGARRECMLVLIGATPEGTKELVGFQTGVRAQSWRELLIDIKQRGLEIAPDLAVGDGALGKAIEEVFPSTRHQRCWVHKTANVLNKVALAVQVNMKVDLREIYERGAGRPQTRLTPGTDRAEVFPAKALNFYSPKTCCFSPYAPLCLPPPTVFADQG
jgi:Transposase, Mutator family